MEGAFCVRESDEEMADAVTLAVRVVGYVQGVGYRAFIRKRATQLGVHGWVRNRPDGSVEVVARGPAEAIAHLRVIVARGPLGARVDTLIDEAPPTEIPTQFEIR
jgi:acylphosphatase